MQYIAFYTKLCYTAIHGGDYMPVPMNYKAEKQLSAKERAFEQIQEWIIDGTLVPGEKINDVDLAKAINISRTPVREALQMLSQQGFVSMKPGVATYVNESNPDDLNKLLPPLAALQALAAEIAAQNCDQDTLQELNNVNAVFKKALQEQDYYTALKQDERFHKIIVDRCENPYLSNMTEMLQAHVRKLFFQKAIILTMDSVKEHEELIRTLGAGESRKASQIARENWMRPIEEYLKTKQGTTGRPEERK